MDFPRPKFRQSLANVPKLAMQLSVAANVVAYVHAFLMSGSAGKHGYVQSASGTGQFASNALARPGR